MADVDGSGGAVALNGTVANVATECIASLGAGESRSDCVAFPEEGAR